ncbi:unnamed protein product [Lactuca saligna]|uniref:Uncharacterized protein n=1 Tax=Lactuca saligna TaxID=75948 RepID=A0AA35YW87_LACSI|nr:unnamed protein product [Lactuca saligna]
MDDSPCFATSPPATSGLPHYKSTNDKLILITEWFHSQLGVRLLHRTDDYECDSSTTPVIASRLTSLTATLIGLSIQLDFSFQLEIDFVPSPALHLFTKISLHLSTKIFTGFCLNHFIERQVNQTIFSIYLTLKNSALNFFVVSNLSRPDLKQELLALGEQIGNAGSRLSEDFISGGLLFNMMIRVAAENQQGGVAAIDHGEMPNNFTCGNKSLYNDRVESFAAAAGEGQDSISDRGKIVISNEELVADDNSKRSVASFCKEMTVYESLSGQATILAALASVSPKLPLGYPARFPRTMLDVARKMLSEASRNTVFAKVEKEPTWLLLSSLWFGSIISGAVQSMLTSRSGKKSPPSNSKRRHARGSFSFLGGIQVRWNAVGSIYE